MARAHCGVHAHELIVNVQYLAPIRPSETPQPVGGNYYLERKEAAHRVANFSCQGERSGLGAFGSGGRLVQAFLPTLPGTRECARAPITQGGGFGNI